MKINSLFISNLRNLKSKKINFSSSSVFLEGKNGQGKTSIIEGIFLLSHMRSFRSNVLSDVINNRITEKKETYISSEIETSLGKSKLELVFGGKKRELVIDGNNVSKVEDFCGKLKTVLFTPEDLEIIKGAPVIRRQFLDRILVMLRPQDIKILSEYSKVLSFRNKLLKDKKFSEADLFIKKLSELNIEIVKKRKELSEKLNKKIKQLYLNISGSKEENFNLEYKSSFIEEKNILNLEQVIKKFREVQEKDNILGRTSLGSHKDELRIDFMFEGNTSLSKTTSSQGQIRTEILSFKLASAEIIKEETGEWPVLLLDDVESELDSDRVKNLRNLVGSYPGQVFITGTSIEIEGENSDFTKFVVKDGEVMEI